MQILTILRVRRKAMLCHGYCSSTGKGLNMDKKMEYETPTLVEVGSFEEITQGGSSGGTFDFTVRTGDPAPANFVPTFS